MSTVTLPNDIAATSPAPATLSLSEAGWREWARRLRVPALVLLAAAIVAVIAGGPAQTFFDAPRRAFPADPRWGAGAARFEALPLTRHIPPPWAVPRPPGPPLRPRRSQ